MTDIVETPLLVEALVGRLEEAYVFPERAARAAHVLRARIAAGGYGEAQGPELCELISADLLEATNDKHLRLLWHESLESSRDEAELVAALRQQFRLESYGLSRVERLPGNIGLIELTIIPPAAEAAPAIAAAMELVTHTYALILDLRETRGGSPDGVAFLCSYFLPDGDVHLTDVIEGPRGPTRQYWTSAYLPGRRYIGRPVHVLTSASTFSGGEELAYDLQALGRATIVGERTRGGAHPSAVVSLTEQIELRLPVARALNPVTGSNWEGVGVEPDVPAASADALETARRRSLDAVAGDATLPEASRTEARRLLDQPS
jgi:C-terminal processing protease CtpA/Prc